MKVWFKKINNLYYVKITIIMYLTVGAAVVQLTLSGETYLLFFPLDKSLKKLDNQLQSSLVFSFTFHISCLLN